MQTHTTIGHSMLAGAGEELLELAATIAWTHHERLDGSGYPRRLKGKAIPLAGRIAAVADTLDALTSDRPYRAALPLERAVELVIGLRGAKLDPEMVDALIGSLEDGDFALDKLGVLELRTPGHSSAPLRHLALARGRRE
jgi:putative two-component system response regulator